MPRFDHVLSGHAQSAVSIVRAGEIAHASGGPPIRKEWSVSKLEALNELAYLRVFSAWEVCLEAVFYRSLCGYVSAAGQETLVSGSYFPTLAAAESAVLGGRAYRLWHNPQTIIDRCQAFIRRGPGCPAIQEVTISSHFARLENMASIRHRIVHEQTDARQKFDIATMQIAGRTYRSSRPGRFLRDLDASTSPPLRWLEVIIGELVSLVGQMT